MKFSYQKNVGDIFYPVVEIKTSVGGEFIKIYALLDSGATTSIFKEEVAEILGITLEKGKIVYMQGVGGRIKGYLHDLKVQISGKSFIIPVIFSNEYKVSFNLLGRSGFFTQFKIIFDEKNKVVELS